MLFCVILLLFISNFFCLHKKLENDANIRRNKKDTIPSLHEEFKVVCKPTTIWEAKKNNDMKQHEMVEGFFHLGFKEVWTK
jgi:hypothetical protein